MKNVSLSNDNEITEWFQNLEPNLKIQFWRSMSSRMSFGSFIKDKHQIINSYKTMISHKHSYQVLRKKLGA